MSYSLSSHGSSRHVNSLQEDGDKEGGEVGGGEGYVEDAAHADAIIGSGARVRLDVKVRLKAMQEGAYAVA